ncbi:transferase [Kiloniella litopenaei]|uniref:Transferase n=1 Tax=Kiloniella litopenaei TaxID=1549748 RepID=A0A0M2RA68_9PROT|nr:acetyltransferase [Kiloniella litopenaei]KKJ76503.1 transferase [Kiloniella litopenaei]
MEKLIIFGNGQVAELVYYMFEHDSDYQPVAFTVDADYITEAEIFGLPVIPFEEIENKYSTTDHSMFVAVSFTGVNKLRAEKVKSCKAKGYQLASYLSSRATTFPDIQYGENCLILEDNTIQPFVTIGDNVYLWSGNHIGHHSTIEDNCFIASHVVISGSVHVGAYTFIGVNATLRDNINIGQANVIGAGCIILKDTEDENVFVANAADLARIPSSKLRRI